MGKAGKPQQQARPRGVSYPELGQEPAKRCRSTVGWFSGFKPHLLSRHKGRIMAFNTTDEDEEEVMTASRW